MNPYEKLSKYLWKTVFNFDPEKRRVKFSSIEPLETPPPFRLPAKMYEGYTEDEESLVDSYKFISQLDADAQITNVVANNQLVVQFPAGWQLSEINEKPGNLALISPNGLLKSIFFSSGNQLYIHNPNFIPEDYSYSQFQTDILNNSETARSILWRYEAGMEARTPNSISTNEQIEILYNDT